MNLKNGSRILLTSFLKYLDMGKPILVVLFVLLIFLSKSCDNNVTLISNNDEDKKISIINSRVDSILKVYMNIDTFEIENKVSYPIVNKKIITQETKSEITMYHDSSCFFVETNILSQKNIIIGSWFFIFDTNFRVIKSINNDSLSIYFIAPTNNAIDMENLIENEIY